MDRTSEYGSGDASSSLARGTISLLYKNRNVRSYTRKDKYIKQFYQEMNIFTVVKNDFVADLAFVVKNDLFEFFKYACDEINSRGDYLITGYVRDNKYTSLEDIILEESEQIKISELTHDSLNEIRNSGYTVYIAVKRESYYNSGKLSAGTIYSILDVLAPKLCIVQTQFALDRSLDTEMHSEIYAVSFDTKGKRQYRNSSVESVEFIEMEYCDDKDFSEFYKIIDNSVVISTDDKFDYDGWIQGTESNNIWVFDKRDGAFETYINGKDLTKIRYLNKNGEEIHTIECQMCRMYTSYVKSPNPYSEKYLVDGMINLGGHIFDTEAVSFVFHERDELYYEGCFIEELGENTYLLDEGDDGYGNWYTTILTRGKNGSLYVDTDYQKMDDEDEEE